MNIQLFLFKLSITVYYIIRLGLMVFPIAYLAIYLKKGGWKYGFTFIEVSLEVALFITFAVSFLLIMYHALSFEIIGNAPIENFLRARQKVKVRGKISLDELEKRIRSEMRVVDMSKTDGKLVFRKRALFMPADRVKVSVEGDVYSLESRPFSKLWFIDFGRNFATVRKLAKWIKMQ